MKTTISFSLVLLTFATICFAAPKAEAPVVQNGGFEQSIDQPLIWVREPISIGFGEVRNQKGVAHSGQYALQLSPNARNVDPKHQVGVSQVVDVDKYQGARLRISCWIKVTEGSRARVIVIGFKPDGTTGSMSAMTQEFPRSEYVNQHCYVMISAGVTKLLVACVVEGTKGSMLVDDISIVREDPLVMSAIPQKLSAQVTVDASVKGRMIPKRLFGSNLEWIDNANGILGMQTNQIREEIVSVAKALDLGPLRFPGGFWADFYHWRDGVGDRTTRPARPHGPGMGSSPNGFGTDEYLQFCMLTGAEPMLQANIITGSSQEAVDWINYCNLPTKRVQLWELGNEQYLNSEDAVGKVCCISIEDYIKKVKEFAPKMKQADPNIQLIAVGGANMQHANMVSDEHWNDKLLSQCGGMIDYLSVHNSYAVAGASVSNASFYEVYQALLAYPLLVKRNLAKVSAQIDQLAPANSKRIKLAVTEYGPLFAVTPSDSWIDHCKTMGSGLYVASLLKAYMETPKMGLANFFKLTEYSFMGCIAGDGTPKPSYYAIQMYRQHFGSQLVSSQVLSPTYDSRPVMQIEPVANVPYLEVISSLSADGKKLSIMVINKHITSAISTKLNIEGFKYTSQVKVWQMSAPTLDSNNGKDLLDFPGSPWGKQIGDPRQPAIDTGLPGNVMPKGMTWSAQQMKAPVLFPKLSITCLVLDLLT
ncbi:MAG: hypothetical protein ACYC1M_18240 [Armatimonadota bacterium]